MQNTKDIRCMLMKKFQEQDFVIDKSGVKTIELVGTSFEADEAFIFREPNEEYIERELDWYLSKSLDVRDIPGITPQIWNAVSSENHQINSNYGFLILSEENHSQYEHALEALEDDPNSRRSIMIYTRPGIQEDYNHDGMSDFICTNSVQSLIRNNKLDFVVNMRSVDLVFGYNNDYAWQKYVQDSMLIDLQRSYPGLELGKIIWQSGSAHLYERHFGLLTK